MSLIRVARPTACGPRVYVLGLRLHHGMTGAVLAAIGCALMAHDRRDYPWPAKDRSPGRAQ